ncbi:MAG: HAMP domain-containing histidine kinase [Clostridia bacterium]|nr:HAMP domain-containing histidine kinase [Clostridia bacterium]
MELQHFLIVATLLSTAAAIGLVIALLYEKHGVRSLRESLQSFLNEGKCTPPSIRETGLARLQNDVAMLEMLCIRERENAADAARLNSDFIADVSHQLKTPLAGLRLLCEMDAAQDHRDAAQKELLLITKMETLVQRLLRLEKLRADVYELQFAPCRLEELLQEVVDAARNIFPARIYYIAGAAEWRCDRQWLGEAIANIVKNAAEHTPDGGKITLIIEERDACVMIMVEDTGGGVAPEQLARLFDRFYRTETAAPDSVGIGLAISKAIVEKHHGTIFAENSNAGLRVTICLPRIDGGERI